MTFRQSQKEDRRRARTPQDKARVREAFIKAGRDLFSSNDPSKISLRQIAAAAGYAPGAIYQYFANQQELFAYIREHDMQAAAEVLAAAISRTRNPTKKVQKLFYLTVDYWLEHMDQYLVLFPAPTRRPSTATSGSIPFGRSPVVKGILAIYYEAVEEMFDSLPRRPLSARLATDTLLASVYGMIIFPIMTISMPWSDTRTMARGLIKAVLNEWVQQAQLVSEKIS
jgi:AcrR family transcriptional regulator